VTGDISRAEANAARQICTKLLWAGVPHSTVTVLEPIFTRMLVTDYTTELGLTMLTDELGEMVKAGHPLQTVLDALFVSYDFTDEEFMQIAGHYHDNDNTFKQIKDALTVNETGTLCFTFAVLNDDPAASDEDFNPPITSLIALRHFMERVLHLLNAAHHAGGKISIIAQATGVGHESVVIDLDHVNPEPPDFHHKP
jgi:hypothetical protein